MVSRNPLRAPALQSSESAADSSETLVVGSGIRSVPSPPVTPPKMGIETHSVTFDDPQRTKRRRDLMLDDEPLRLKGWTPRKWVAWRTYALWAGYLLTGGILAVIAQWPWLLRPFTLFQSKPATDAEADFVIVDNADGSFEVCGVEPVADRPRELLSSAERKAAGPVVPSSIPHDRRMLVYRHTRYVYNPEVRTYVQLDPEGYTGAAGAGAAEGPAAVGLTVEEASHRLSLFGRNAIDIPIPPSPVLLLRECVHPFVAFQIFSVLLWCTENYFTYAAFIAVTALASAVVNFWEVRKNLRDIRALSLFTTQVTALRLSASAQSKEAGKQQQRQVAQLLLSGDASFSATIQFLPVDSSQLVPGDVIEVTHGMKLPADCVLLSGSCTVNEAMLTGESTVVIKAPLSPPSPGGLLNLNSAEPRHTLFGGSLVVQLRVPPGQKVLAAVVRTGFETVKGRLVLSILHPKAAHFKFLEQSFVFIALLFVAALGGLGVTIYFMNSYGAEVGKMVQKGCDLITIVVPPALPLALTVGVAYALVALRKRQIFCISPPRVNLAGKVNCFCFDKTGTLTSEGLELSCIRPAAAAAFGAATCDPSALSDVMVALLAACHSLTYVMPVAQAQAGAGGGAGSKDVSNSNAPAPALELSGDPLELKTFHFTGASLVEPHHGSGSSNSSNSIHPLHTGHDRQTSSADHVDSSAPPDFLSYVTVPWHPSSSSSSSTSLLTAPHHLHAASPLAGGGGAASGPHHRWRGWVVRQFEFIPALQRMGVLVRAPPPDARRGSSSSHSAGITAAANEDSAYVSFVKGSPEVIASLCDPSTLPSDYARVLAQYTHKGFRVLGAGYRRLSEAQVAQATSAAASSPSSSSATADGDPLRALCESSLVFCGFIVLENALKPATADVIAVLRGQAGIPVHMVTGDNPVSAVCIARQAGMVEAGWRVFIGDLAERPEAHALGSSSSVGGSDSSAVVWRDVDDEASLLDPATLLPVSSSSSSSKPGRPYRLALTGRAFTHLLAQHRAAVAAHAASSVSNSTATPPPLWPLHRALLNCAVLARMSPDNKAQLVEELQACGLYVGMCGDGSNDALALRAAHVGVSLSQVEASVSAPFTSRVPDISCIPLLLAEGRGALTTSFCLFQFMALYSTIQFANALFAITRNSFLSNNEYLYQDLFIVFVLALTLGSTPAAKTLTRKRPSGQLLSGFNLVVTTGFILVTFLAQGVVFAAVRSQPWYGTDAYPTAMAPGTDSEGTNAAVPETSSLFLVAMYQYVGVAAIFSVGHPWKSPTWTNRPFCAWLGVVVAVSTLVLFLRDGGLYWFIGLQVMPPGWHGALAGYSVLALGLYAVFIGAVWSARRRGLFSSAGRAWRAWRGGAGAYPKPHKRHRAQWEAQLSKMASVPTPLEVKVHHHADQSRLGTRGSTPLLLAPTTPTSSASGSASAASSAVSTLGSAVGASGGAFPIGSAGGRPHRRPMEDDTAASFGSPPPLGALPPPPPPVTGDAAAAAYSYDFGDYLRDRMLPPPPPPLPLAQW